MVQRKITWQAEKWKAENNHVGLANEEGRRNKLVSMEVETCPVGED